MWRCLYLQDIIVLCVKYIKLMDDIHGLLLLFHFHRHGSWHLEYRALKKILVIYSYCLWCIRNAYDFNTWYN